MEERSVRVVVYIIGFIILSIIGLSIYFIVGKINKDKNKPSTEEITHNYTYVSCVKEEVDNVNARNQILQLTYDNNDLSKLDIKYNYSYRFDFDKDDLVAELNGKIKNDKNIDESITGDVKVSSGGVEATLSYDLTKSNIRIYVNNKYFYSHLYDSFDDIDDYLSGMNYKCNKEKAIN